MVDWLTDQMFDFEDDYYREAEEDFILPEKECKYCGKSGLKWMYMSASGEWKLVDKKNKIHKCKRKD